MIEEQRQAELARVGGRLDVRTWQEEGQCARVITGCLPSLELPKAKTTRERPIE